MPLNVAGRLSGLSKALPVAGKPVTNRTTPSPAKKRRKLMDSKVSSGFMGGGQAYQAPKR